MSKTMKQDNGNHAATLEPCVYVHDWEAGGGWGVIIGVSRCRRCGKLATEQDFPARAAIAKAKGD